TSPLFVMNIAYDAYLGRYIGTPQAVDQSGKAAQQLYVTDDLSTQKWRLLGDTGDYTTASWYRWLLDGGNRTDSMIIGKNFRSYCSFGCSKGSLGEYVDITVDSSEPAAAPVEPDKPYRIGNGAGRLLAQVSGGSATTSVASVSGNDLTSWAFSPNGDGSFRIANASTHQLLGVDSTSTTGRKWGTKPVVNAAGAHGPTVGQQWFIVPSASGKGTQATTFRLVNRYSGLVLGMSSDTGRLAETTPARHWTNATGNAVGGSRTAGEQTLTFTPSASASRPAPSSSSTSDIPPRTPPSGSPSAGTTSSDAATGAGSCTDPAWDSTTIYTGGETVSYRHGRWKARWWTRNNEPGGPTNWGQWEEAGVC
ncbi:RICIN domain-containing protein, partial [Streptomyces actinomycinicus]|nr:RICIN domain-containing protein [Streptomyces actinomycinicus]